MRGSSVKADGTSCQLIIHFILFRFALVSRSEMLNGLVVIFLILHFHSVHLCQNLSLSISPIHSWNFYSGQSQPANLSCSWFRPRSLRRDVVVVSLRAIEIDDNREHWSNELLFKQENDETIVADLQQRSWTFDGSLPLEILFRAKPPLSESNSLNIHRFLLDWIVVNRSVPLLCRSNQIWCYSSRKSLCIPREQNSSCLYSTRSLPCDTILIDDNEQGQVFVQSSPVQTRCYVIMPKDQRRIQLNLHQLAHLDVFIADGNDSFTRLSTLGEHPVRNHLAIISVQNPQEDSLFNLTWTSSPCPANAKPCREPFEKKCYTEKQRCDGSLGCHLSSPHSEFSFAGIWQCSSGDDELGCAPYICPNSFSCNSTSLDRPRCYPLAERCNGNPFCANQADEQLCSHWWCNAKNGTFLCKNLHCIYEMWTCDGQ